MHGGLFGARQRLYDVPVAVDVLIGGRYPGLPKGIQYCGGDLDPRPTYELSTDREEVVGRVDRAVRLALLRRGGVPQQFSSSSVRNGVLTLAVEGEFQLMVTLEAEKADADWTLLGVELKVKAREGESIAAPTTDYRQQRYLHEVVQKAMAVTAVVHRDADQNGRGTNGTNPTNPTNPTNGTNGTNPLLAAYEVCHDLCCGMVLEILHAQAVKLASRVRGLWATQLVVIFHKESQVLDLCLWQGEFSAGLGGTGLDVGVGGVRVGDAPSHHLLHLQPAATATPLPPPPTGCRFLRVHRPVDRHGKILTSLGPVEELLRGNDGGHADNGNGEPPDVGGLIGGAEEVQTEAFFAGAVSIDGDDLSCGRMLLAAARTFASHKIQALVSDVQTVARQLRNCAPRVTIVGGLCACICPWGHGDGDGAGAIEVSVDVKSGRYLVKDTPPSNKKAMALCVSRLQEALNLLPKTATQSLGESIAATLSARTAGRSVLHESSRAIQSPQDGEQQDLRQQQVRRCMLECFGLLRRGEVEHVLRRVFGTVPHERWQALLGRTTGSATSGVGTVATTGAVDAGLDFRSSNYGSTRRTFVRLGQFVEGGVRLSDEWRGRSGSYHPRRRRAGGIQLTKAERAATRGQAQTAEPAGLGLGLNSTVPVPQSVDLVGTSDWKLGGGALPSLAGSLVGGYDGGVGVGGGMATRPLLPGTSLRNGHVQGASGLTILPADNTFEETGEVLSFFLEVGVTASLSVEHTLITAALSTAERARFSLRPVVGETYQLIPLQAQGASPCGSLEAALLPPELPPPLGSKRSASLMDVDEGGLRATGSTEPKHFTQDALGRELGLDNGSRPAKKAALSGVGLSRVPFPRPLSQPSVAAADPLAGAASTSILYEAVHICDRLVPFARLQHALLRVGTGLSLDFHQLTRFSGAVRQGQAPRPQAQSQAQPHCAVFLAGESGWSSGEVSALSAKVSFFAGHTQADRWEWDVTLGLSTMLVDYQYAAGDVDKGEDEAAVSVRSIVHEHLPLVKHIDIGTLDGSVAGAHVERSMSGGGYGGGNGYPGSGKVVKFRFPPDFSVHVMCRSFALAGEGLTAMHTLAAQATKLLQAGGGDASAAAGADAAGAAAAGGGYRVVSSSPIHVALRDSVSDHVVLLTHSSFSAKHISSAQRPGLVLIPLPNVPTCPAAMRELEAAVRKHRDLGALLHGLSWTVPILAVVALAVPGVGSGEGVVEADSRSSHASHTFVLTVVSPACFVLSARSPQKPPGKALEAKEKAKAKAAVTLMVEAKGQVRVSGVGRKEAVVDTAALRDMLLEWIASSPE
ncbi:unnamed protein product [Laminaria digitata]